VKYYQKITLLSMPSATVTAAIVCAVVVLLIIIIVLAVNYRSVFGFFTKLRFKMRSFPQSGVLLIGSSSVTFWRTPEVDLSPLPSTNIGIVGTRVCDWVSWLDDLVVPFHPRAIVIYVGANDLAANPPKSAHAIAADLIVLFDAIFEKLGVLELFFVSVAPTRKYWRRWETINSCNEIVRAETERKEHLHFIDIGSPLLAMGSPPPAQCYRSDGEHFSEQGYQIWRETVCPPIRNLVTVLHH
jgi:lysophospholipase L1-like esterase